MSGRHFKHGEAPAETPKELIDPPGIPVSNERLHAMREADKELKFLTQVSPDSEHWIDIYYPERTTGQNAPEVTWRNLGSIKDGGLSQDDIRNLIGLAVPSGSNRLIKKLAGMLLA